MEVKAARSEGVTECRTLNQRITKPHRHFAWKQGVRSCFLGMHHPAVTHVCVAGGAAEDLLQRVSSIAPEKSVYVERHPGRVAAASIYEALSRQCR